MTFDAQSDQARVAPAGGAPPLDELQTPAGSDEPRVDLVDAVLGERLEDTLDGRGHQQVDVVVGKLALEVKLNRADAAAEPVSESPGARSAREWT